MRSIKQVLYTVIHLLLLCVTQPVLAECGGETQCIGIGITPNLAAEAHHDPSKSTPSIAFGNQGVGTVGTAQTVYVSAVTGPAGTQAVLNTPYLDGADSADFRIVGGTCSTSVGPIHGGMDCTIELAFAPVSLGSKTATLHVPLATSACASCITERTASLYGDSGQSDPAQQRGARALQVSQVETVRRVMSAQTNNIQRRLQNIHQQRVGQMSSTTTDEEGLARTIVAALGTGSLGLDMDGEVDDSLTFWLNGAIRFGARDATTDSEHIYFDSDGISLGVDREFASNLILGLGIGVSDDLARIDDGGSRVESSSTSFFLYGSYRPSGPLYLEGSIGFNQLELDLDRYVASLATNATGRRTGDQLWASILVGYDLLIDTTTVTPFARLAIVDGSLDSYDESGAGASNLRYASQDVRFGEVSLGIRFRSLHETSFGWSAPHLTIGFDHQFEDENTATMSYLSPVSTSFQTTALADETQTVRFQLGNDFIYRNGLKLAVDYSMANSESVQREQSLMMTLSGKLDDDPLSMMVGYAMPLRFPVQVEAGFIRDDNINRTRDTAEQISDTIYHVEVDTMTAVPLGQSNRLLLTAAIDMDRYQHYDDLRRNGLSLKAELQHRTSAMFDAFTLGAFLEQRWDQYASAARDGAQHKLGISVKQSITDRVGYYFGINRTARDGKDPTFDTDQDALSLYLNYAIDRVNSMYLGMERIDGDTVASTSDTAYYAPGARAQAPDGAFKGRAFSAVRYGAGTDLFTLGFNLPLGSRDAIDLSVRAVDVSPDALSAGYSSTQFSAFYLMRF